jgi:MoaA/NifB/PqqE/SkfB family radical SAM enzyme
MSIHYRLKDYLHFARMLRRNQRRQRVWAREYESSIRTGSWAMPNATVMQLLPTEECNLRCPMCNQWGENGYLLNGTRIAEHMDEDGLTQLMRSTSPGDSLISIHGGEPFAYKHISTLLALLEEQQFDVMLSTNGTLLTRNLQQIARVRNLSLLLSIDGDATTHDRIRGEGRFSQAKEAVRSLFALRRQLSLPLPMVAMSFVVCEWNADAVFDALNVAKELGVFVLNYNMRWFLTEEIGLAYEQHLDRFFGLRSSGAWRGWVSNHPEASYGDATEALRRIIGATRHRIFPPYVVTTPRNLQGEDFQKYFEDYFEVFDNETCFMPFYWARIHANGDLIYCPGHPDIIVGNVFRNGFANAFNSEASIRFRRHILDNRMPICNRCCGLYMTHPARKHEQNVRRRLGLPKAATFDLSQGGK